MGTEEFLKRVASLRVFENEAHGRAPHKPLLLLYALGRLQRGDGRNLVYPEVERDLGDLLREFGPPRETSPHYPFWHLQSDGMWTVDRGGYAGQGRPPLTTMREERMSGALPAEVQALLRAEPHLIAKAARILLERHFPETMHAELSAEVGIDLELTTGRGRDPAFRAAVLEAYGWRCAVCGLHASVGGASFALDAAHVRWRNAAGPDAVTNGLALCVLHHRALDRGVLGIGEEREVLVSAKLRGGALEEPFLRHHRKVLLAPHDDTLAVEPLHAAWHRDEVFLWPARGAS